MFKWGAPGTRPNLCWLQGSVSLITRRLDQETAPCLKIMLDKAEISKVPSQKCLGVTLYRNMAYDSHVDDLCKKLSKHIGLFKHSSPSVYKENKEKLVITEANGVMKPTPMYGSTVWDSSCAESLQRVSQASEQGGKNSKRRRQKNAIDHALFHKAVVN